MFSNFLNKTNAFTGILPVITVGNGAVNGVALNRTGYLSAAVVYTAGICPSIPTGFTAALKIQDSPDGSTGWADFVTIATLGTAADLSAASTTQYFDVNIRGAKKYIRVVQTLAFTGGTSPSQLAAIALVLGDKNIEPANVATVYGS